MAADTTISGPRGSAPGSDNAGAGTAARFAVLRGVLHDRRRSLVLWSIAIVAITGVYVSFYPAMGDGADLAGLVEGMPEGLVSALGYEDLGSVAGYLHGTVFALLGPALLLVFGIGWGGRTLAGVEEDGTLELELTHPVSRAQVYLERLLALWLGIVLLTGLMVLSILALLLVLDLELAVGDLLAGSLGLLLFGLALSTVALATGAATGRRGAAVGTAAGLAVAAFVADALGPIVDGLAWLTDVSPWSWYLAGDPLLEGVDPAGFTLLAVLALAAALVGLLRYRSRDLGV